MNKELKDSVMETALDEIGGLLREHIHDIDKSMCAMLQDHDKESPLKYNVSLGLVLEPRADQCLVSAKISYSVKHSDKSVGQLADPMQTKFQFSDGGKDANGNPVISVKAS